MSSATKIREYLPSTTNSNTTHSTAKPSKAETGSRENQTRMDRAGG